MSESRTSEHGEVPVADPDRRFYAFVVDRALAWTFDAVAAWLICRAFVEPGHVVAGLVVSVGVGVLVGAVLAGVLGLTGTSPGLALTGLRVVRDQTGAPLGLGPALLRQGVLGVAGVPTLGLGAACLAWTALADPSGHRRGWHDRLARSVVVDVRPAPVAEPEPDLGPRHVVNLTAMRLVPAPAGPPAPPPPPLEPPRHAAPTPDPPPAPAEPRRRLGYPLLPQPRAGEQPAGAHAARGVPAEEPAPIAPRWRLRFDTGESFVVEGLVLVGRRPEARNGEDVAHLVPLRSEDMSLSKTHAQLQPAADGALVVTDRGSTNGSFLVRQGVPRGLPPGRGATLVHGDHVRFGDREMTVLREP